MTVTTIDFQDGTDGAALAAGTSGVASVATSGGSLTYSSGAPMHGSLGMDALRNVSTGSIYGQWSVAANTKLSLSFYIRVVTGTTSVQVEVLRLGNASDTNVFQFHVDTAANSGNLYWTDNTGANKVSAVPLATDTYYRVAAVFDATAGTYSINVYNGDSTTPINATPYTGSGYNLGAAAFTFIRAGITSNGDVNTEVQMDDIAWEEGSTAEIPPPAAPTTVMEFDFEDGTVGNSFVNGSSGTQYVTLTGGTVDYTNAIVAHGTLAMLAIRTTATGSAYAAWWPATANAVVAFRFYIDIGFPPDSNISVLRLVNASDTSAALIQISSTGHIVLHDANNANEVDTGVVLANDKFYRVEVLLNAATGSYSINVYDGDTTTPLNASRTGTGYALGSAAFTEYRVGVCDGGAVNNGVYIDDFAYSLGRTTEIGPILANTPPAAYAGEDQTVEPFSVVTLHGGASNDVDGTITSFLWEQLSGPAVTLSGASTATATFTAPAGLADATLEFQLTVTDNEGATGTDTVVITVLSVTDTIVVGGVEVPLQITYVTP